MKLVNESIFLNTVRSFFVALFGALGAFIGLFIVVLCFTALLSTSEEKRAFPSNIKVLPDADGNRKELSASTPAILQISIDGIIGADPTTSEKIEELLLDSREDSFKNDRVKAILLVIDSPGGGVSESDTIYRLIQAYKKQFAVPVYAYVNGMCASGGYYIACAAEKIFASPTSLIGSVGVVSWPPYLNVVGTMEKLGIAATTLSAGKGKDTFNPTREWTPNEGEHRQELIDIFYKDFVNLVSKNRPHLNESNLVKIYGAEVFTAHNALENGYIDEVVDLKREAIKQLAAQAGISESYQVVCFKTKSWWKELFKEQGALPAIKHELSLKESALSSSPCRFQYQ